MTIRVTRKQCWTRWTWTSEFQGYHFLFVKHAQSTSVRELIQKIENHTDRHALQQDGQGDGVPKACLEEAVADSRGSRICVCAITFSRSGWHTQGVKDELTSCRGTVQSAWQKPPVSRKGGRAGLPKKGKWPPRGTGTTVLTYPCPSQPCFGGSKECARVTGKAGENGQHSGAGRQLTLDKTVGLRVWWHTQDLSKLRLDQRWWSGQPGSRVAIDWVTSPSSSFATTARCTVRPT